MDKRVAAIAGLLVAGFILASTASAFGGRGAGFDKLLSDDVRTQLDAAIASNDYESFKLIQSQNFPSAPIMTQEQFAKIVEQQSFHTQVEAAIDAGNYAQWKTLMEQQSNPHTQQMVSTINADNFHLLKELKDAQAKVENIQAELGVGFPMGHRAFAMHGRMPLRNMGSVAAGSS